MKTPERREEHSKVEGYVRDLQPQRTWCICGKDRQTFSEAELQGTRVVSAVQGSGGTRQRTLACSPSFGDFLPLNLSLCTSPFPSFFNQAQDSSILKTFHLKQQPLWFCYFLSSLPTF